MKIAMAMKFCKSTEHSRLAHKQQQCMHVKLELPLIWDQIVCPGQFPETCRACTMGCARDGISPLAMAKSKVSLTRSGTAAECMTGLTQSHHSGITLYPKRPLKILALEAGLVPLALAL